MNCFTHRESAAVAVCKACGRAVCPVCAIDLIFAVACSEGCQKESAELHQMNEKAKRIYGLGGNKKLTPMAPFVWALLGAPFVYLLISEYVRKGAIEWFALIFLVACISIGVISWRRAKTLEVNC